MDGGRLAVTGIEDANEMKFRRDTGRLAVTGMGDVDDRKVAEWTVMVGSHRYGRC